MSLKNEMQKQGEFLFRWRSYFPLVFALFMFATVLADPVDAMTPESRASRALACLSISIVGLMVRIYTVGFVPRQTSGRNTKKQVAEALNTTGIYSVVRHPLYVGNFLSGLGIALYTGIWWMGIVYTLSFYLYYERIMFAEEEFLRGKFGEDYETWSGKTPAFLPRLSNYKRSDLNFSLRAVLRREYPGLFAMILGFALLDVVMAVSMDRTPGLIPIWQYLVAGGAVLYVILRTIKRYTRFFHVAGR
jgi:protein-S-isoprenylcysteine O-methyltransferase Ste14